MKPKEREKIQRILKKIETNEFDENDIDNLLIKLREYSRDFPLFRELADFVAHNDKRNKGKIKNLLESMYLSIKYFRLYVEDKKTLDIYKPFPSWIKRLMLHQVDKCNEAELYQKYKVRKDRLKNRIQKHFKENKSKSIVIYDRNLSYQTLEAIGYVMSFIYAQTTFTQDNIIQEIINILKKNNFQFDENEFRKNSNCLMLCILFLVHNTEFLLIDGNKGYCKIQPEFSSISITLDKEKKELIKIPESFGNLEVRGSVIVNEKDKELNIVFPVITTNLKVEDWCDISLFEEEEKGGFIRINLNIEETNGNYLSLFESCKLIKN